MSHEALIRDLRQKNRARMNSIRREAEARVEELRRRKREELEQRQAEVLGRLKDEAEKVAAPILHEARRSALTIEDEALRRLSERLHALALNLLGKLREQDYDAVFAALFREVPAIDWEWVQVSPQDTELAGSFFSGAEVKADPLITGGFVAGTDGGRYQVVNTLERRLEKGWQAMLPHLLQQVIKERDAGPA